MVTFLQVSRGVGRTIRAIDRENKRAARQRAADEMAARRQSLLDAASGAVAAYDDMIAALTGSHRIAWRRHDWMTTANAPEMPAPEHDDMHERHARAQADGYIAGWMARTLRLEARKRAALEQDVVRAREKDDAALQARHASAAAHNAEIAVAKRVVAKEPAAIVAALDHHSALGKLPFSVEGIEVLFTDDDRIIAMVDGLDLEDMPSQSVNLLQSGKASIKAIPKGKILELHRDNICSAAIRVALEFLQTLPIEIVEVVMHTDLLDNATGHIEPAPVLHLRAAAQALEPLNLARADAYALVDRLGGRMDWSKRDGFRAIELADLAIPID